MKHRSNLTIFTMILSVLACLAFLPQIKAAPQVVPAPDGCYPGFTTAEGCNALQSLTTGAGNTGVGWYSLFLDTTGSFNTGVGAGTLVLNTGESNTAVGTTALLLNTIGISNTAVGRGAMVLNDTGSENTAVGVAALPALTTGSFNTAIGGIAGFGLTSGSFNIMIGDIAGGLVTTQSNTISIGAGGQLGTMSSSGRFKKDIKQMDKASEAILALKPVTFHYKSDNTNRPEFGLIAEEVAKVNPDLVVRDDNGQIYTVRYEAVNAMLLNEFLKEHRKNEDQQAMISRLEKQVEALSAGLQKVSAQLELDEPAQKMVL